MPKEIKITYRRTPDFRLLPITGAWGGPTANGEIVAELYVEYAQEPESSIVVIDEQSGVASEKKQQAQVQAVREILVGIVMRPDIALSVGQWLVNKANVVLNANAPATN